MAAIAILLFFIPLVIVLFRKMWADKFLRIFSLYCVLEGIINLLDFIPVIPHNFISDLNVVYNMLDFPMMLFLIYQIAVPEKFRIFIKTGVALYFILQFYFLIKLGLQYDAIKYPIGLGLVLVLSSVLWMLINFLKRPDLHTSEKIYLMVLAAILFDYGTFVVIYIFDYFMADWHATSKDNLFLYYASSIVGMLITIAGLLLIRKKPKSKKPKQGIFYGRQPITEIY